MTHTTLNPGEQALARALNILVDMEKTGPVAKTEIGNQAQDLARCEALIDSALKYARYPMQVAALRTAKSLVVLLLARASDESTYPRRRLTLIKAIDLVKGAGSLAEQRPPECAVTEAQGNPA